MLIPKRVKRRRVQRGRMKGKATKGNQIAHGEYGLVALSPAGSVQSDRGGARRHDEICKEGRTGLDKHIPSRSPKARRDRMASGKRAPEYWVATVKPGSCS